MQVMRAAELSAGEARLRGVEQRAGKQGEVWTWSAGNIQARKPGRGDHKLFFFSLE